MSKTKIAGYLLISAAAFKAIADLIDGNGFNFAVHFNSIAVALQGAGFVFARHAIEKLQKVVNSK